MTLKKGLFYSLILCCAMCVLSACSSRNSTAEGWYLRAENGANLVIIENYGPISMSDQSRGGALFEGLDSGDFIEITLGAVAESYPAQAGIYTCKKLSEGALADVPADAVADLVEMGYTFGDHNHIPADEPLTVDDPVSGYCGNTITEVLLNGGTFSFWGGDSVTLTDLLINLDYDPDQVCRCLPEFTVNTEFGSGYEVNLAESYVRCETGQTALTAEQVEQIRGILERNCT